VRRFVDEIFVQGQPGAVDELLADDFVPHPWPFSGDGFGSMSDRSSESSRCAQWVHQARCHRHRRRFDGGAARV
jgi:hypothetical protein